MNEYKDILREDCKQLSYEEFLSLHTKWMKDPDNSGVELAQMIESVLPMCVKVSLHYKNLVGQDHLEDLVTSCKIAAIKSLKAWNPEYKVKYSSFVYLRLRREAHKTANEIINKVHHPHNIYSKGIERSSTFSMDAVNQGDGEDTIDLDSLDFLGVEDEVKHRWMEMDNYNGLIAELNEDEKYLINHYFLYEKPWKELSEELGVSKQCLDARRHAVIKKLRRMAKRKGLRSLGGDTDPRMGNVDDDGSGYGYGSQEDARQYYKKNKNEIRKYQLEYYHKHKVRINKRRKEKAKEDRERKRKSK